MPGKVTLAVTEFRKRSFAILNDLQNERVDEAAITKRGKPIAQLEPVKRPVVNLFGCMKGQVTISTNLGLSQLDFQQPSDTK